MRALALTATLAIVVATAGACDVARVAPCDADAACATHEICMRGACVDGVGRPVNSWVVYVEDGPGFAMVDALAVHGDTLWLAALTSGFERTLLSMPLDEAGAPARLRDTDVGTYLGPDQLVAVGGLLVYTRHGPDYVNDEIVVRDARADSPDTKRVLVREPRVALRGVDEDGIDFYEEGEDDYDIGHLDLTGREPIVRTRRAGTVRGGDEYFYAGAHVDGWPVDAVVAIPMGRGFEDRRVMPIADADAYLAHVVAADADRVFYITMKKDDDTGLWRTTLNAMRSDGGDDYVVIRDPIAPAPLLYGDTIPEPTFWGRDGAYFYWTDAFNYEAHTIVVTEGDRIVTHIRMPGDVKVTALAYDCCNLYWAEYPLVIRSQPKAR